MVYKSQNCFHWIHNILGKITLRFIIQALLIKKNNILLYSFFLISFFVFLLLLGCVFKSFESYNKK